ncbi:hypothetical protein BZM27_21105 [Paraburkholderia steynii]|uniref:Uncharacterized protein n=1 Tax=Paraburkholderia steynii TaxID=1245441 RepID=A0A4R0XH27_9BURK|nr:hypothetical protein BZM27_21105 [Paraburkholderia steynii]
MRRDVPPAPPDALTDRTPADQIAAMRSMMWGRQLLLDSDYTASGASKRYSPDETVTNKPDERPSNSKYIYKVLSGQTVLRPGPRGRYGYDIVADVDSDPKLTRAKQWFTHPLLGVVDPDVSLWQVREILHGLGPWFAETFFVSSPPDKHPGPFWTRRETDVTYAVERVNYYAPETTTGSTVPFADPIDTELTRFVALWCLYREAKLCGDARATAICHWAIWDAHDRVSEHPVFAHVFQPYLALVQKLEPEGIRTLSLVWPPEGELSGHMRPTRVFYFYPQCSPEESGEIVKRGFSDVWKPW